MIGDDRDIANTANLGGSNVGQGIRRELGVDHRFTSLEMRCGGSSQLRLHRLDVYIYDYLVKRNLQASAKAFQAEGKVSSDPVAIDAPGGFLFEWWSVFWDIFIARTNEKHSEVAASYIEHDLGQLQQEIMEVESVDPLLVREGGHLLNGTANGLVGSGTANIMAAKMYEERLKLPHQRDSLDDTAMKQRFGDNVGHLLDPNHASMLKSAVAGGQPSGQVLHGTAGGMSGTLQQVQARNQQLPGSTQDIKSEMNPVLNPRAAGPEGSLVGVPGTNQGGNNLTLKGWPLTGLDQFRSGILQQQKSFIQSPQPFHQLQLLSPQQQHQLLLQAQQNLTSPSGSDVENRRMRMLLSNRNTGLGKDGQSNSVGDVVPNVGSPMQAAGTVLPRGDNTEMFMKSQSSNHHLHQQDKMGVVGSVTVDGSMSNSFRGNDQTGRKRKQPVSSSGPANSSGTANTAGPSPSSAPSTPSTHTPGDVISMPTLPHSGSSSKPLIMFGSDGTGTLTSPSNQLWDDKDLELQADMDRFVDGSLDDNVESFLSHDDTDPRDTVSRGMDVSKGTFTEVGFIQASTNKVICCDFSSDGKLLASGGHDKKAVLWYTDSLKSKTTLEEHSSLITDVRFSPSMPRLATSSFDKTVRVWDADNPGYSLRTFTGHSASVMSLDFHPNKEDLICSCDGDSEMRYWSINNGSCARVFKGGTTQMRFQPRRGRYLAAAAENVVSILDVETQACRHSLQGHSKPVHSVCWDPSGELLASVSEDSVRVWTFGSGGEGDLIYNMKLPAFQQSLELWNMAENKTMTVSAHEGLIAALAVSNVTGLVASASHDNESVHSFSKRVSELDQMVKRMVFESLGIQKYYDPLIESKNYLLRVMKHRGPEANETKFAVPTHTDKSLLSILNQNQVNGLEAWSNDRLYCPKHHVMMSGKATRYSTGLFSFSKEVVRTPEELVDEEHPLLFKPFDHMGLLHFIRTDDESVLKAYCGV
ncbi:hypothetical protein HHK36_014023 [Tetracentron sinense]|uniref:Uncharacterized protein n=1 Tax=Tetracentron sinense TaxID=13715 RepID=A0A835DEQ7_TETSI|nr:hypothetical protein HHK36_014023 [Tetracentron sinense]